MSTTLTVASPKSSPRPKLWTCDEYHGYVDSGALDGKRSMLIEGTLLKQDPMNAPHGNAVEAADEVLRGVFGKGWRVRAQLSLVLGLMTDPHPDIAVVPGSRSSSAGHPTTASLVIEVADSSLKFDTTEKAWLYAMVGIPEYWVVDTENRQILVFRDPVSNPDGFLYKTVQTLSLSDSVTPLAAPGTSIRVADLLP